jgi:hypothetical protein
MSFLPENYNVPKSLSHYYSFEQGDNIFRILGDVVLGWEDWENNKPIRTPYTQPKPEPIGDRPVKHFWAFPIWDYKDKSIKILEITQASIQSEIANLYNDKDWGLPTEYDINVRRTGESLETRYSIIAKPPKPLSPEIKKEWEATDIDLNKLFTGEDPFNVTEISEEQIEKDQEEDIPVIDDSEYPNIEDNSEMDL